MGAAGGAQHRRGERRRPGRTAGGLLPPRPTPSPQGRAHAARRSSLPRRPTPKAHRHRPADEARAALPPPLHGAPACQRVRWSAEALLPPRPTLSPQNRAHAARRSSPATDARCPTPTTRGGGPSRPAARRARVPAMSHCLTVSIVTIANRPHVGELLALFAHDTEMSRRNNTWRRCTRCPRSAALRACAWAGPFDGLCRRVSDAATFADVAAITRMTPPRTALNTTPSPSTAPAIPSDCYPYRAQTFNPAGSCRQIDNNHHG